MNINTLTDYLIRPPRFTYSLYDLGGPIFQHNQKLYERVDFEVSIPENLDKNITKVKKIYASLWRLKKIKKQFFQQIHQNNQNVLIYLHCNCGSRVEATQLIHKSLDSGYNFIAYDSRGCGHSQGQYISLGYHEILDLELLIKHVAQNYVKNPKIILWGRSMGAVTAINFLTKNKKYAKNVKVAVLDSPFINLKQVVCEIVNKKIGVPKLLIQLFLSYLQPIIYEKARFKISQFDLRSQISKIKCPLILMASKADGLVPFKHLQQIYDLHRGKKSIFYLNETHTDQRTSDTVSKIFRAVNRYFLAQKKSSEFGFSTINISKLGLVQLQSFRSSQFIQQKSATIQKRDSKKKIELTCPYSSGRKNPRYTQFSTQQACNFNQRHHRTQTKKQKLSLNHCQSTAKIKKSNYISIQLFKTQQKNNERKTPIKISHQVLDINQNLKNEQENRKCINNYLYKHNYTDHNQTRQTILSENVKQNNHHKIHIRKIADFQASFSKDNGPYTINHSTDNSRWVNKTQLQDKQNMIIRRKIMEIDQLSKEPRINLSNKPY